MSGWLLLSSSGRRAVMNKRDFVSEERRDERRRAGI